MRFIKDDTNINFVRLGKKGVFISVIFLFISVTSLGLSGLNLGIDFVGGTLIEFQTAQLDILRVRSAVQKIVENSIIYKTDNNNFIVKIKLDKDNTSNIKQVKHALDEQDDKIEYRRVDYVGSQISRTMITKGIGAMAIALAGVMIYLYIRFNLYFAFSGIITLLHDVLLLFGFFSVTKLELSPSSIAAILTMIGYSINDSVVIYDSIRNQTKNNPTNTDFKTIINSSLNTTLSRTIFTSLTTLIAALVLALTTGETMRPFSWAVFFGIIVGTYSSIVISSQCLLWTGSARVMPATTGHGDAHSGNHQ